MSEPLTPLLDIIENTLGNPSPAGGDDCIILHHGTSKQFADDIRGKGIDVNSFRDNTPPGSPLGNCDFGPGFYTTTDRASAESWAKRRYGDDSAVLSFKIPKDDIRNKPILVKGFRKHDKAWEDFVSDARQGKYSRKAHVGKSDKRLQDEFDVVEGLMYKNVLQPDVKMNSFGQQTAWISSGGVQFLQKYLV